MPEGPGQGWRSDPWHTHEYRYYSGGLATTWVSSVGLISEEFVVSVDELLTQLAGPPLLESGPPVTRPSATTPWRQRRNGANGRNGKRDLVLGAATLITMLRSARVRTLERVPPRRSWSVRSCSSARWSPTPPPVETRRAAVRSSTRRRAAPGGFLAAPSHRISARGHPRRLTVLAHLVTGHLLWRVTHLLGSARHLVDEHGTAQCLGIAPPASRS